MIAAKTAAKSRYFLTLNFNTFSCEKQVVIGHIQLKKELENWEKKEIVARYKIRYIGIIKFQFIELFVEGFCNPVILSGAALWLRSRRIYSLSEGVLPICYRIDPSTTLGMTAWLEI